tara:strand:+ start:6581 stop:6772 length:192 start_codon:yes stop_codon:yes gene_type:complete
MIRNIRHIQIKKIAYHPKLFQAIITFEDDNNYDESDDIEEIKLQNLKLFKKKDCYINNNEREK